jgi:hypothetical protein
MPNRSRYHMQEPIGDRIIRHGWEQDLNADRQSDCGKHSRVPGMRCACLASRSTSESERKSSNAGLAARQAFLLHGSASSGAL